MRNVVIIGSGCAGNTAAIYAARANLKPLVVGGHEPGGQLSITSLVENFPGFPEGINGPDLVENMKKQAEHFGAEYIHGSVTEVDFTKRPFRLNIDGEWHETHTVIIASGASARWLNLPSEQKLIGHGVSSCATCDGFFYRGKKIMVIGGGDSAMEEANFLTRFGEEVTLVHRRDAFRASKIMVDRTIANPKIKMVTNTVVDEVHDGQPEDGHWCDASEPKDGRNVSARRRWFLRRNRTHPEHEAFCRQDRTRRRWLHRVAWRRPDQPDRRVSRRRRAGPDLPASHYGFGAGCMAAIEVERFLEAEGH